MTKLLLINLSQFQIGRGTGRFSACEIYIKQLDDQAVIDVFVTDVSGTLVDKKELIKPFSLETKHLMSGVYTLLVADRSGNSFTLKMIKN